MSEPNSPRRDSVAEQSSPHGSTLALALGALGVVFGDIGTSPLYTFQECIHHHNLAVNQQNVFGIVSLIFWSLTLVVTVKYVALLMRADNRGEGGIMALVTLLPARLRTAVGGKVGVVSLLVIAGAALLFGDGVITPAISVLSAMEGLVVAKSELEPYVVPLTCGILVGLFAVQRRGTGTLGALFGPVMTLWFLCIAALGAWGTVQNPGILAALSPTWAAGFFAQHGLPGAAILGSVVLAVTGGEALYADMGHFGRRPIRIAWMGLCYPCLVLSYLGQGANVLAHPTAAASPFFSMVPAGPWTYALVVLAAAATVIASQGLISAVFSLTYQALRLGYLPRVEVEHTSSEFEGRIYVPLANQALAVGCIGLVLVFQHSSKLAAAFGLAVSGTMAITSIVFAWMARHHWGWPRWKAGLVLTLLLALDLPFFAATCLKFFSGGYLPFAIGAGLFLVMTIWVAGRSLLSEQLASSSGALDAWLVELGPLRRLPGLCVVMSSSATGAPAPLVQMARRFAAAHEAIFLLTITTESAPWVDAASRLSVVSLGSGVYRVLVRYGYMEDPVLPSAVLHAVREVRLQVEPASVVYLLGRESFMKTDRGRMSGWREAIFAFLSRNAQDPTLYFKLPPAQVLELGSRVDL